MGKESRLRRWGSFSRLRFQYTRQHLWEFFRDQVLWGLAMTFSTYVVIALFRMSNERTFWVCLKDAVVGGNAWALLIAVAVMLIFMSMRQFFFVAPYKLYQLEKEAKEKLQTELEALTRKNTKGVPDLQPLSEAIRYISHHTSFGRQKTYQDIVDKLIDLHVGLSIQIRGRETDPHSQKSDDFDSVVQIDKQSSCTYGEIGNLRKLALVVKKTQQPPEDDLKATISYYLTGGDSVKVYSDPVVSMSRIKYHFPALPEP